MRDSIVFYRSFYEAVRELPSAEFKDTVTAIMEYGLNDIEADVSGVARAILVMAKPQIDKNNKRYENGSKGGRKPTHNQTETKIEPTNNQTVTKVKPNDNVNVNDNVKDLKESKEKKPRFSPPSLAEVTEYVNEHGLDRVDPERFMDYYTGNGWMVGKNKMKDWKACCRNWNRSQRQELTTKAPKKNSFTQANTRAYDFDQLERTLLNSNGGTNE